MANLTLSGYLTTAAALAWAAGQSLTSLTSNEYTDLTDEIDNTTNKYAFADLYVELGSAAFTGATSALEVFLIPSVDGTNYPTWTGNGTTDEPENTPFMVAVMPTTQSTAAQKMTFLRIPLPQGKYKWAFRNRTGVALAASANTAYWRPGSYAG